MARDSSTVYSRYLRSCEKRKVEPLSSVLDACKAGSGTLSLAGTCVSVEQCGVLARTLQYGHPYTELDFSDCLMGNEGLSKLVEFLRDDVQITSVILKGNSIRSNGAHVIADLLKRNASIQRLSLEWNSLGLHDNDIKALCEGLSMNTSLCILDLRSNHIDHTGASHIANMLLMNTSLQELDLRWNNVGVLGGRKLLSALRSSGSLVGLRLEGNSIPSDIVEAIGTTLSLRLNHHVSEAQHQMEALQLSAQLNQLQSDSKQKVLEVLDTLDSERTAFLQTTQLSQCEVADLKCHLEERDTTIARLETKLLEVQGALRESLTKSDELCRSLDEVQTQASSEDLAKQSRIEGLEKDIMFLEEKRKKELSEANARERATDTEVHSLELEVQVLKGKLAAGGRDLDTMRETLTSRITLLEAQLSEKDSKIKEQLAQLQLTHQNDLLSRVEESKVKEAASTRKLLESSESVAKLEKELRSLRAASGEDKGRALEEEERLQQALKLQAMKCSHLEDQMEELKSSHRSKVEHLRSTISQGQSEKERLEQECGKLQQKLKSLHQEFEGERSGWEKAKDSHRRSLQEQIEERDMLSREIKQLKKSLEKERKHIIEMEEKRESDVRALQNEREGLRQKLEQQRAVIQRFQVDEQQRLSQLKAALNTYFTTTPKLAESDIM